LVAPVLLGIERPRESVQRAPAGAARTVLTRALAEQTERVLGSTLARVQTEVLREERRPQRADGRWVPERRVQLGVGEEGARQDVRRADRRPGVVDEHDLRVHVDVAG